MHHHVAEGSTRALVHVCGGWDFENSPIHLESDWFEDTHVLLAGS